MAQGHWRQRRRLHAAERGESLVEVVVAIFLLASVVVLVGAGANLWQTGMRWSTLRYEVIVATITDLAMWPPEPQMICGSGDQENWWEQISLGRSLSWDQPAVWVADQGWLSVPTDSCLWIAPGEVRVIKVRGELVDTVVSVERPSGTAS
jgi:hypothetical protein